MSPAATLWVILQVSAGVTGPELAHKHLAIVRTETAPAPGLVATIEFGGLRPGYFIEVALAAPTAKEANAFCAERKKEAGKCYVRPAGPSYGKVSLAAATAKAKQQSKLPKAEREVLFAQTIAIRGRDVPLVLLGIESCEEDPQGASEAWLFWDTAGSLLGTHALSHSAGECCKTPTLKRSPKGLHALTFACKSVACGGACTGSTRIVAVPEADLLASLVTTSVCTKNLAAASVPEVTATCDRLTTNTTTFRLDQYEVDYTPCPDDDYYTIEDAHRKTRSTRYTKDTLRRTTSKPKPYKEDLWGCE